MKMIFTHENRMILFNIRNLLQAEGIETRVVNEFAGGAAGNLPAHEIWPQLWLEDESRLAEAQEILHKLLDDRDRQDWYCRGCQELNDASFQVCWKCGRAAE